MKTLQFLGWNKSKGDYMKRSEKIRILEDIVEVEKSRDPDEEVGDALVKEVVKERGPVFQEGWYSEDTDDIDYDKIDDDDVREAFRMVNNTRRRRDQETMIQAKINEKLGEYDWEADPKMITRMLDRSKITVDENGEVVGVDEAIQEVIDAAPSLVRKKAAKKSTKPTDQGFNPGDKGKAMKVKDLI